jgi:hypothetical protein
MLAKKLYAFPISRVFHLDRAGKEHFLGLRVRWNTGETEIAWDNPGAFRMGLIFEEPIPATSSPGRAQARPPRVGLGGADADTNPRN